MATILTAPHSEDDDLKASGKFHAEHLENPAGGQTVDETIAQTDADQQILRSKQRWTTGRLWYQSMCKGLILNLLCDIRVDEMHLL